MYIYIYISVLFSNYMNEAYRRVRWCYSICHRPSVICGTACIDLCDTACIDLCDTACIDLCDTACIDLCDTPSCVQLDLSQYMDTLLEETIPLSENVLVYAPDFLMKLAPIINAQNKRYR